MQRKALTPWRYEEGEGRSGAMWRWVRGGYDEFRWGFCTAADHPGFWVVDEIKFDLMDEVLWKRYFFAAMDDFGYLVHLDI